MRSFILAALFVVPFATGCSDRLVTYSGLHPIEDTGSSDTASGGASSGSSGGQNDSSSDATDATPSGADTATAPADRTLAISWVSPFAVEEPSITLSGEFDRADGSYGFTWRDIAQATDAPSIAYQVSGVVSGDALRFSVEYVDAMGHVSWGCIAPYPSGTLQGTTTADVDGVAIPVETADDPTSNGCDLRVTVP